MTWAKSWQILRIGILLGGVTLLLQGVDAFADTQLHAEIQSDTPEKAALVLKNTSSAACQIANTAMGTTAITKVTQNGHDIKPTLLDSGFDEGLDKTLGDTLKTLKPGESVTLPLREQKNGNTVSIQSVVWSAAGDVVTLYQVDARAPLQMELNYSVPVAPISGAPLCGAVQASSGSTSYFIWYIVGGSILFVLIVLILWFLLKKRKHKQVVAVVAVLAFGWVLWHTAPTANATITVPPSMQSQWDACMATLQANRDITGPILDLLNSSGVHVVIDQVDDGDDYTTHWPDGTYHINWDPNHVHRYAGTGGMSDTCTTLYHEMDHILQMENGTYSRADCAGSGIETKEVLATREQNRLRVRLGLPARSHYGNRPLPTGDCTPPSPHRCTGGSCGDSNGDPHLLTFDGKRYDFQAAGEFVLARSKTGDFEIQTRQQPWQDSPYVAVNTAVAIKVGGQKAEFQVTSTSIKLLVDGKNTSLADMTFKDGTTLAVSEETGAQLTWQDGTSITIRRVGGYGLDAAVDPSPSRAGQFEGLLGDANGDETNDLKLRGKDTVVKADFSSLYPAYADSWRISQSESLFTYDTGKSTSSYVNRDFPHEYTAPNALPGYDAAKKLCQQMGVVDDDALADCALDIAITGRPEFAMSAAFSQAARASSLTGGTLYNMSIKNPGDSGNVTFNAKAGEKVFVAITGSTFSSQCGSITLRGPDDAVLTSGCIINHTGEIDTTTLPADGTYTIRMTPDSSAVGDVHLRLFRVNDTQTNVSADGSSHSLTLTTPGMVGRFQFNGTAGQRIFVNVPNSTLPSMCGALQLVAADGTGLSSGCIINGKGNIDTTVLPATGSYSVVINPDDIVTGALTVQVISADVVAKTISVGDQTTLNLSKPGDVGQVSFTATAGQRVFIDMTNATLPSQCGGIYVQDNVGTSLGACIINGAGSFDGGLLIPTTGTYMLIIDPADAATGNVTVKLHT